MEEQMIDKSYFTSLYKQIRLQEFLEVAHTILLDRLENGYGKTVKGVPLGCLPVELFRDHFQQFRSWRSYTKDRVTSINGEKVNVQHLYFTFNARSGFPTLSAGKEWIKKRIDRKDGSEPVIQEYQKVTFIISYRDTRVECDFKMSAPQPAPAIPTTTTAAPQQQIVQQPPPPQPTQQPPQLMQQSQLQLQVPQVVQQPQAQPHLAGHSLPQPNNNTLPFNSPTTPPSTTTTSQPQQYSLPPQQHAIKSEYIANNTSSTGYQTTTANTISPKIEYDSNNNSNNTTNGHSTTSPINTPPTNAVNNNNQPPQSQDSTPPLNPQPIVNF